MLPAIDPPTILLIDCETSGLYRDELTMYDDEQPWIMSIAAELCRSSGKPTNIFYHMIKADGRTVKEGAQRVHGLDARTVSSDGILEARMLGTLTDMLKTVPQDEPLKVVSYGDFDIKVITSLLSRFAKKVTGNERAYDHLLFTRTHITKINLMAPTMQYICQIPSQFDWGDYKYPTLDEACAELLGMEARVGEHNPLEDLIRLKALLFECKRRGYLERDLTPISRETEREAL